jgi:hypothetical protein
MRKIAHTVLQKGQIIKSKSGEKEWVVVETSADEVLLAAISSYKKLSNQDAMEWNLLEDEDLHHL